MAWSWMASSTVPAAEAVSIIHSPHGGIVMPLLPVTVFVFP
jgi:hypothetical protein